MENFFKFFPRFDSIEDVNSDLIGLISDKSWSGMVNNLKDGEEYEKNYPSNFENIKRDKNNVEMLFSTYSPSDIANYFIIEFDSQLFLESLSLSMQNNPFAIAFLDTILRRSAKSVIKLNIPTLLSKSSINLNQQMKCLFQHIFDIYFEYDHEILMQITNQFKTNEIISFLFNNYQSKPSKYENLLNLLSKYYVNDPFDTFIKQSVENILLSDNLSNIEIFLDFLEFASIKQVLNYEDKFRELIVPFANYSLVKLLVSRAESKSKDFGSIQADLLPEGIGSPLKRKYSAPVLDISSDDIIFALADTYDKTGQVPIAIYDMFNKNKFIFDTIFKPKLLKYARTQRSVQLLHKELVRINMIESSNDYSALVESIKQNPLNSEMNIIDAFKQVISSRQSCPEACYEFEQEVIQKIPPKTRAELAKTYVDMLKSDPNNETVAMLALRLPINRHMLDYMIDDPNTDVTRLITIHRAALRSSETIIFRGKNCPPKGVYIDVFIVQRLRWRYRRGDTRDTTCIDEKFMNLADDDIHLFMKWEINAIPPISAQTLNGLQINTHEKILAAFNAMTKLPNISDSSARTFLANVNISCLNIDELVLGETPNFTFLSMTPFTWDRKIITHSHVCKVLKHPDVLISSNLLYLLDQQKHLMLLAQFPHAFAAILFNLPMIGHPNVPDIIRTARSIIDGSRDIIKPLRRNVSFAVVSVIVRSNWDIVAFLDSRSEPEWVEPCMIFSVCENNYGAAQSILKKRFDAAAEVLRNSAPYEELFFGVGSWNSKRAKFAVYCAQRREVIFHNRVWIDFLEMSALEVSTDEALLIRSFITLCQGHQAQRIAFSQFIPGTGYV